MARDKTDKTDETPAATLATSATRAANEWGIPDWRDAAAYGLTSKTTIARWLWEFTRRRDDYRSETLAYLDFHGEVEAARKRMKQTPTPDAKCAWGTLSERAEKLWMKHWRKWGYSWPLDPRVSEYPHDDLLRWPHVGVCSMRGSPDGRAIEMRNRLIPAPEELAVTINLDRPLAEQMALVKRAAKREQKERHGRLLQRRKHETKWLGYLRVLDARDATPKASWPEIADLFHAQGVLDRRKNPAGGYCAPPPQAARDMWLAADALRFNF